jgi:mono/diheme cytochrome c family protein
MSSPLQYLAVASVIAPLALGAWSYAADAATMDHPAPLPLHLRETGLYAEGSGTQIDPRNLAFSPQYPLWSDSARKRRWIYLPPGTAIDASNPDAWEFPPGTRLWKEFSLDRPVETRFIERLADGTWRYASYVWSEDGTDATLAPSDGGAALASDGGPRGAYVIPSESDCRACHEGAAVPVLGFSALQLSPDRDPLAPHTEARTGIDLRSLTSRGLIRNLPAALTSTTPRIAASSPLERAALGYLHGNCGHCHNDNGAPAPVDLKLAQSVATADAGAERVLRSMVNAASRFRGHGLSSGAPLIAPGQPNASVLIARVRSRNPQTQMPPLGTRMLDSEALALLERWIADQSHTRGVEP